MKKRIGNAAFTAAILTIIFSLFSCEYGTLLYNRVTYPVGARATELTVLEGQDVPQITDTKYSFLILTDSHFGTKQVKRDEDAFLQEFEKLLSDPDQTMRPRFIINLGDSINAGRQREADKYNAAAQAWVEKAKSVLGVSDYKIYSIIGNHDLYNDGWKIWKKNIWPYTSFYKFKIQDFSFYFLDSGNGTLGEKQFEILEKNLGQEGDSPKIILCHYPIYANGMVHFTITDSTERNKMIALFGKSNVKYYFCGHLHPGSSITSFNNFKEVVQKSYVFKRKFGLVTIDNAAQKVEYKVCEY